MSEYEPLITVTHLGRDQLRVEARGHVLFADQPIGDGGDDTAPSPTEIFLAGLTACVAYYAERFLRRHQLSTLGLSVSCDYAWAENPHRVGEISLVVKVPSLPAARREAFTQVIEHCAVHNTLQRPPDMVIRVMTGQSLAA